ncbi:MAG TPA: haloacid dehalogenase-like hydrolase [Verrucomicrobiae bacterium]|jgi:phosphoglycolate phosphatase-like HAD superfamily hydrolase
MIDMPVPFAPRPRLSHAVFDFDGTLSWLRHGWPELMLNVFLPYYPMRADESKPEVLAELLAEILSNNGRPSIFQMRQFAGRVQSRGGSAPAPERLLEEYQGRLDQAIAERAATLEQRGAAPDEFIVSGARAMLELLQRRGVKLFILSGTLEERVRQEAEWLDLARYFGGRIFGSPPDSARFSKRAVLDQILAEDNISGENLLCFGDGPVEILHTRELGGLAVAVASDENHNGSGQADPLKRQQLVRAGAHLVIADYRDPATLASLLFHD